MYNFCLKITSLISFSIAAFNFFFFFSGDEKRKGTPDVSGQPMLRDPGSMKGSAIFSAACILPLLQSNRKFFVQLPVGIASAEMFPWRQGIAERIHGYPVYLCS